MSDISNRLQQIVAGLSSNEMTSDANKIDTKKNRSAGTRVRKQLKVAMDELKALRSEVLEAFKDAE